MILPKGLESIGSDAFGAYSGYTEEGEVVYACQSLKTIVLPKSLTYIGDGAFFGSGLSGTESEPFIIPVNVAEIRWDAFQVLYDGIRASPFHSSKAMTLAFG
ncbi:MAG: leucine-rich repeat protein [Lachnospiraceae bacterium]